MIGPAQLCFGLGIPLDLIEELDDLGKDSQLFDPHEKDPE